MDSKVRTDKVTKLREFVRRKTFSFGCPESQARSHIKFELPFIPGVNLRDLLYSLVTKL
jgi:hypothetical protein